MDFMHDICMTGASIDCSTSLTITTAAALDTHARAQLAGLARCEPSDSKDDCGYVNVGPSNGLTWRTCSS
jgi:hypothetical protein